MKRLYLIPILVMVLLLIATPVFAADPSGMEVDVVVVAPGDVDLDVGINAGGDVDVTVDGVDFKQTAGTALAAYNRANEAYHRQDGGAINSADWYRYWNKEMAPIGDAINNINGVILLIADAEAKLIQGHELTTEELSSVQTMLASLDKVDEGMADAIGSLDTKTSVAFGSLQERDEVIWNQLMYGAEAHITILNELTAEQKTSISGLQVQVSNLTTKLETADTNNASLLNYTDYLQRQYLYYFWILGGVVILLSILLLVSHLSNKKHW